MALKTCETAVLRSRSDAAGLFIIFAEYDIGQKGNLPLGVLFHGQERQTR